MKCRFSPCGRFLHVVTLEGQHKPISKREQAQHKSDPKLALALLVSTYRLCNKQVSRSPPSLLHNARVELGPMASLLSVSELPVTLTWTPKVLYLTSRHVTLQVHQVHLFNSNKTTKGLCVTRPREVIVLPDTAVERDVYYFPPADGSANAQIIIGSESSVTNSPPIGCFVHHEKDLGGWSECQDIPKKRGFGQFTRPLEKFNPEEDCDCEQ